MSSSQATAKLVILSPIAAAHTTAARRLHNMKNTKN